jgi:hypothetical protein
VRSSESTCPFCAAVVSSTGLGVAVVFAGLALVGCEKKGGGTMPPPEPDYGVAITDTAGADDDGGALPDDGGTPPPDTGTPPDDGGVSPGDDGGSIPAEPEYGVADPG